MRTGIVLLLVIGALAGCKREPTFEERYDAANRAIVERAKQIDAEIAPTGNPTGMASGTAVY